MNCSIANTRISLLSILHKQGYKESYSRNNKGKKCHWFISPFREERTASFVVNEDDNTYKDWGTGESGTVVDYMVRYYRCSVKHALSLLDSFDLTSSFVKQKNECNQLSKKEEQDSYEILAIKKIQNHNLIKYLNRRKIDEQYWKYLCEVHFKLKDKVYYAVGFENDSQGYELSWEYWNKAKQGFVRHKMCLVAKDITHIKNGSSSVVILESWSDFVSLLSLYPKLCLNKKMELKNDFIIMNSVSTKLKVFEVLSEYSATYGTLYASTDNDPAGMEILNALLNKYPDKVIPLNGFYKDYKDVGDYLLNKK
ncbi:CHC2 zinc finger domain-containing protein [Sphingobacterium hungaricum]|uniref:Zinc finger CHC2-type domain-containing protein n=1 Tax=Sphingobacterium hungaricum TaxID=2082723 RepID=A0A928UW26_9SPHI|nr:CHC2 zinc finger domain-containing protein [Sphingobacterium hungaricum]MBE8714376.1 hypothetical protein [Sphingobacterium hungaricum]